MKPCECNRPPLLDYNQPKPILYYSKSENKSYILFTPNINDSEYVIQYDIGKDLYINSCKYPLNFCPMDSSHTLDDKNDNLYIIGGEHCLFGILNIKTRQFNRSIIDSDINIMTRVFCSESYFISSLNEIHLFGTNHSYFLHIKYSIDNNKFESVYKCVKRQYLEFGTTLFVESKSKVLLFKADSDMILLYDFNSKIPKWDVCNFKSPKQISNVFNKKCIVLFNNVIIMFQKQKSGYSISKQSLFYTELTQNKYNEWKHHVIWDYIIGPWEFCIITHEPDDYIHFFNTSRKKRKHLKISIFNYNVIPKLLIIDKYKKLIHGYINIVNKELHFGYIYQDVIDLVDSFFPLTLT